MHAGDSCLHQGTGSASTAGGPLAVRVCLPGCVPAGAELYTASPDPPGPPKQGTDSGLHPGHMQCYFVLVSCSHMLTKIATQELIQYCNRNHSSTTLPAHSFVVSSVAWICCSRILLGPCAPFAWARHKACECQDIKSCGHELSQCTPVSYVCVPYNHIEEADQ